MKRLVCALIISCFLIASLAGCNNAASGQKKNTNLADLRDAAATLIAGEDAPIATKMAEEQDDVLVYRYYAPESTEELPLILYFHGAGVTGDDNISHITSGGEPACFVTDVFQDKYPCYVLAPQLSNDFIAAEESPTDEQSALGWTDPVVQTAVFEMIEHMENNYHIDKDRIYIMGHSMGGLGVWGMITAYPDYFAAAVPVSGMWNDDASMLDKLPMWVFHGENDSLVPLENQQGAVEQIKKLNGNIQFTVYSDKELEDAGVSNAHMANQLAFYDLAMYEWLFAQSK